MSDETKLGIEIYRDGASPAVKVVGQKLENTVRTALRPVDLVLWTVNQAFDWLSAAVARRLAAAGVDDSEVVPPDPVVEARILSELQVAGPLEDAALRELLAGLLAQSMTRKGQAAGHPLYVGTLRQLTAVEARVVCWLASAIETEALLEVQLRGSGRVEGPIEGPIDLNDDDKAVLPALDLRMKTALSMPEELVDASIAHLAHLGVVEFCTVQRDTWSLEKLSTDVADAYRRFQEDLRPLERARELTETYFGRVEIFTIVTARPVRLSQWGKGFADACDARAVWRELR